MAAPPEVHSALLNVGGTPVGIELAGASWKDLAAQYFAAVADLEGILAQVQSTYQGPTAEKFVAAHQPYLVWLNATAVKAGIASMAHDQIAAAYTGAVVAMPTIAELTENHVVHGVLIGTNFFGCNTVPIGLNEVDYQRMWVMAADVMSGWDATSTASTDEIPLPMASPFLIVPGVGEASSAAASAAAMFTQASGAEAGAALGASDMLSTKLLAGQVASSPVSGMQAMPSTSAANNAGHRDPDATQPGTNPENMASSFMQQMASMAPSAVSAWQGLSPQQLLSSAPQMLSSAPQTLSQMLGSFSSGSQNAAVPVGFAGTAAINGMNPAGLTSLAGGAFGSGPTRPLMPSTWGAIATTAAEPAALSNARTLGPMASLPGAGASSSGGGSGMMGSGAARNTCRASSSQAVTTYADDGADLDDELDDHLRGEYPMSR